MPPRPESVGLVRVMVPLTTATSGVLRAVMMSQPLCVRPPERGAPKLSTKLLGPWTGNTQPAPASTTGSAGLLGGGVWSYAWWCSWSCRLRCSSCPRRLGRRQQPRRRPVGLQAWQPVARVLLGLQLGHAGPQRVVLILGGLEGIQSLVPRRIVIGGVGLLRRLLLGQLSRELVEFGELAAHGSHSEVAVLLSHMGHHGDAVQGLIDRKIARLRRWC